MMIPDYEQLQKLTMNDLFVRFNATHARAEASVNFWSQQIAHRQQLCVARRMEQATRRILCLTVVIAAVTIFGVLVTIFGAFR